MRAHMIVAGFFVVTPIGASLGIWAGLAALLVTLIAVEAAWGAFDDAIDVLADAYDPEPSP